MAKYFFTVLAALLAALLVIFLVNCTENSNPASATPEKSADLSNTGSIKGCIQPDSEYRLHYVYLLGGEIISTDSNGYFEFQFLKPDTYAVILSLSNAPDSSIQNIVVQEGIVTDLGTIVPRYGASSSSYPYVPLYLEYKSNASLSYYDLSINRFNYSVPLRMDTLLVNLDSIHLRLHAYAPDTEHYEYNYAVKIDGVPVTTGWTSKLNSFFNFAINPGYSLYEVNSDTVIAYRFVIFSTYGLGRFFSVAVFDSISSSYHPDLDIFIVNSLGDTCSYIHPAPDWGVVSDKSDNPRHLRDVTTFYYGESEEIDYFKAPDGIYSVYVRNFADSLNLNGRFDPSRPYVKVKMNDSLQIVSYGDTLRANEVWNLGNVMVPEMVFEEY